MLDQADRHLYVMVAGPSGGLNVQLVVEVKQAAPAQLPDEAGLVKLARLIATRLTP